MSSDRVEREEDGAVTCWLHSQGWPGCSGAEPTLPSEHRVEGVRGESETQEQNCPWDASQSRTSRASFPDLGLLTKPCAFPKGAQSPKFSIGWGGGYPICLDLWLLNGRMASLLEAEAGSLADTALWWSTFRESSLSWAEGLCPPQIPLIPAWCLGTRPLGSN